MSIASEIARLQQNVADIISALIAKGVAATGHTTDDFASDIAAIPTGANIQSSKRVSASVSAPTYVTPDSGYDGLAQVIVNMITRQAKTVTPSANEQTVTPDSGYKGLSSVTVEGDENLVAGNIKSGVSIFGVTGSYGGGSPSLQSKSVSPSTSQQVVSPDSGYDGLSSVTVAAIQTQTKSCTPSASQQAVTPDSGKFLTQVTVAGDSDLIASNIKKDVQIFGVTGTYEGSGGTTNGSLIEVTCSSNIDAVTATVNGNTYSAYITGGKAYITIPYTDTTVARTCTLKGYASGTQVTSATVSMAAGVGYYTASLSTSAIVYDSGTWTGVDSRTWTKMSGAAYDAGMSETVSRLQLWAQGTGSPTYAFGAGGVRLDPAIDTRGYSKIEITLQSSAATGGPWFLADDMSNRSVQNVQSSGIALTQGANVFEIPAADKGKMLYLYFTIYAAAGETAAAYITKIRFI